jgi:cytochrome P450
MVPWRPRQRSVFAFGPDWNRIVLSNTSTFRTTPQTAGGPTNSALRRIRHGLTAMNGDEYRQQRQLVTPLFVKKAVDSYHAAGVAITDWLLSRWSAGQVVDMHKEMHRLSLRISSHVLFGREPMAEAERKGQLIEELFARNFAPLCWLFPFDLPGTPFRRLLRHAEHIERVLWESIHRRRSEPTDTPDILDMLIQAHAEGWMTDAALLGQATILFAASFETQANTLNWTMFLLAQHPKVMAELSDELRFLQGAPPNVEQLERLPYLDAVLKESMRILPTVPYTIRAVTEPTQLGEASLEVEDRVVCSHYVTHHMPEIYPEPECFRPQRWFTIRPSPYEYLPFSAGRICIGRYMSLMLMRVSLAMIVQRWRLTVVPGARVDRVVRVTLGPKYGLPMIVTPQDQQFSASPIGGNIHEMVDMTEGEDALRRTHRRAA